MNKGNRQARAKRRAKPMRLQRRGVPFTRSRWTIESNWMWVKRVTGHGNITPGDMHGARKTARRGET